MKSFTNNNTIVKIIIAWILFCSEFFMLHFENMGYCKISFSYFVWDSMVYLGCFGSLISPGPTV